MAQFQCTVCKRTIKAQIEKCCSPNIPCKDGLPFHCGEPMVEIID